MKSKWHLFVKASFCLLLFLGLQGCKSLKSKQNGHFPNYILHFDHLATTWDEGIPLGNANLGTLLWEKEGKLHFSLDKADLWDLRPMENLDFQNYNFDWVKKEWENDSYENVQKRYDIPYDRLPAPSKIPGAAMEFDISLLGEIASVNLILKTATCEIRWKNGTLLRTFVHATDAVGWYQFENLPFDIQTIIVPPAYGQTKSTAEDDPVTGQDLRRLNYSQGSIIENEQSITYTQKAGSAFEYQVKTVWKKTKTTLVGCWSITSKNILDTENERINSSMDELLVNGMEVSYQDHLDWWKSFWNKSMIKIPDSVLQNQWYMEMYKFGSAARSNAPPISLQSVWTADNGKLPPWKGDYHHDLNTQLSYWPSYSGNHLDLEIGYINWLLTHKATFKKYTREFYGTQGLNVPGVTTLTGEPMGGWIQYAFGPTVSAWLGQHFYLHWRYTMDRNFLKNHAYPWIADVATHLHELSIIGKDGKRKLPLSSSPEINNNDREAWFNEITNFDLALIRWTFDHSEELALELGLTNEAQKWKTILSEWPQYSLDEKGLMIAPNHAFNNSHRHFSHLMAIHPLGDIDVSKGEIDQEIIEKTIHNLDSLGSSQWVGYSFSWLGNLKARALDGDGAAKALKDFASSFVLPNSFHANGDQSKSGKSNFTYRPFTLEGNFAFASGLQEMLIQSHSGTIRIFPAIPTSWANLAFNSLRTEGAFLISSAMKNHQVKWVQIVSEQGGRLRIENPFSRKSVKVKDHKPYQWEGNSLIFDTYPGEKIEIE